MKFYPLSLQDAVMAEAQLAGAKTYKVNVPAKPDPQPRGDQQFVQEELQNCSVWQLLNLDVDDACRFSKFLHCTKNRKKFLLSYLVIYEFTFTPTHSVNMACAGKLEYPEKTHDVRQTYH
jgi:hypothetical protein